MGDLLEDDDFGDFVVVAPTTSAARTDSFNFGGPVEPVVGPDSTGPKVSHAQNKDPTPSELMLSLHGLKKTEPSFTKPTGALPDIFGLEGDFSFSPPQTSSQPSIFEISQPQTSSQPSVLPSVAQAAPPQSEQEKQSPVDDDWGDFSSPKPPPAEPRSSLPPVKTSKPPPLLSSFGVQPVSVFGQGPIRTQSPQIQSPKSTQSPRTQSPRTQSPRIQSPKSADLRPLSLAKKHSPRSSPKRSSPLSRRSSLDSPSPRRSSLDPSQNSPRNPALKGPVSKAKGSVLIGNLMPPAGTRALKARKVAEDANQARFAMAAGLASEWASDFKGEEQAPEAKAAKVQAPVVDLMDWGDEPAANGTPAAANDDDFGDDFGDFVSATSSTSTSRRTSDMDFLSTIDPPLVSSTAPPSKAATPPNGLSTSASNGVAEDFDFFGGEGSSQAEVGPLEGFKEELVQKPSSADPFLQGSGLDFGPKASASTLLEPGKKSATDLDKKHIAESVFASPLTVDFGTSTAGAKPSFEASTPKSTLHVAAPPLFPDSASPNGLSSKESAKPSPLLAPESLSDPSHVSEAGSEKSSVAFGVSETGRLSKSIFGEDSDEESEPLPQLGVQIEPKKPPPSIEALLNSNAYEASVGKAWSGTDSPKSGNSLSRVSSASVGKAASISATLPQQGGPVSEIGQISSPHNAPSATSTAHSLESLGSFSFGIPVVSPQQDSASLEGLEPFPAVATAVSNGQGIAKEPSFEDDDFGDFESASQPRSSGATTPGSKEKASTSGAVPAGSTALEDALFGDFDFPGAPSSSEGFSKDGSSPQPKVADQQQSLEDDLFGGFETSGTQSSASKGREDLFGGIETESASTAHKQEDLFGGFELPQGTATAVTGDPFASFQSPAGNGVAAGIDDPFGAFQASPKSSTGQGTDFFAEDSRRSSKAVADPFEILEGPSNVKSFDGSKRSSQSDGVKTLGGSGQVSSGLADLDFLSGSNEASSSKAAVQGDPFLDLMGMEASSSEAPIEIGHVRKRSFSARREKREHSRRSSDAGSEEGSVRKSDSWQGKGDSWQEITPQKLEKTSGSGGSGKRRSYKESDLLEVAMQLLEQGRLAEARACRAHLEAQKKLPEKKAQYERSMIESPMKAFDVMKDIHGLEGALASSHEVAKWQQASMGSRRNSLSKRPELTRNGSLFKEAQADVPLEAQEAFVRDWEDLAHACADELEEGQEIWQQALDAKCEQELLVHPKGQQYFAALCRVYFVVALLSCLCRWRKHWLSSAGDSAEGLQSCLADCRRTAEGSLKRALKAASDASKGLGFSEVWTSAQCAVLEAAVSKSQRQPVCALTLIPQSALKGVPLVSWQGHTFLSPVANLWANRISTAVPQLPSL